MGSPSKFDRKQMKEQLRELLHRDPFVPFRIVMTSGHEHDVTNPDLVAVGESQINVYTPKSDRYVILRLNQIASIHVAQAA
jgi:hypothetical protein